MEEARPASICLASTLPHIAVRLLVRRYARYRGGGDDRLDRIADPDSVLVGRVRGYRHDPRRRRRLKSGAALVQVTVS